MEECAQGQKARAHIPRAVSLPALEFSGACPTGRLRIIGAKPPAGARLTLNTAVIFTTEVWRQLLFEYPLGQIDRLHLLLQVHLGIDLR